MKASPVPNTGQGFCFQWVESAISCAFPPFAAPTLSPTPRTEYKGQQGAVKGKMKEGHPSGFQGVMGYAGEMRERGGKQAVTLS
jgi:hypothetical protein